MFGVKSEWRVTIVWVKVIEGNESSTKKVAKKKKEEVSRFHASLMFRGCGIGAVRAKVQQKYKEWELNPRPQLC